MIFLLRYQINILSLGEDKARALGSPIELVQWIDLRRRRRFISAGVVATSGIVGWVGLVIPHIARALVGADHGRLLPVSALIGAIYCCWSTTSGPHRDDRPRSRSASSPR